jgi:hypothetical protein
MKCIERLADVLGKSPPRLWTHRHTALGQGEYHQRHRSCDRSHRVVAESTIAGKAVESDPVGACQHPVDGNGRVLG